MPKVTLIEVIKKIKIKNDMSIRELSKSIKLDNYLMPKVI